MITIRFRGEEKDILFRIVKKENRGNEEKDRATSEWLRDTIQDAIHIFQKISKLSFFFFCKQEKSE